MATKDGDGLEGLVRQLQDLGNEAGARLKDFLDDVEVKQRFHAIQDGIEDLRLELERRFRGGPATRPFEEMNVQELHHLAGERNIEGRSSMNKAELIDALRTH